MKRLFSMSLTALLALAASAWGGGFLCNCTSCMVPPAPRCPDCSCPCDHGLHFCPQWQSEHAHQLICKLQDCSCCERIRTVKKLGCRLHADFCCDHDVLEALINALQCDTCWEVRRAAAWSIQHQNARTEEGVMALYIASKMDPHYLVRVAAGEALDILIVGRRECFEQTFKSADELIKDLKKRGYKPGSDNCRLQLGSATSSCCGAGSIPAAPIKPQPAPTGKPLPSAKPAAIELTPAQ